MKSVELVFDLRPALFFSDTLSQEGLCLSLCVSSMDLGSFLPSFIRGMNT